MAAAERTRNAPNRSHFVTRRHGSLRPGRVAGGRKDAANAAERLGGEESRGRKRGGKGAEGPRPGHRTQTGRAMGHRGGEKGPRRLSPMERCLLESLTIRVVPK